MDLKNASNPPTTEELLTGLVRTLQILLETGDFPTGIERALAELGAASRADRVYIFEHLRDELRTVVAMRQRYEWAAPGISRQIDNPVLQNLPYHTYFADWKENLLLGIPSFARTDQRPEAERIILRDQGIASIAAVPIFVRNRPWGFIGFDGCDQPRDWQPAEIQLLQAAASGIASAIERHEADEALREANATLATQSAELQRSRRIAISLIEDAKLARERADAASNAKSTFLAVMSHEMRTPLNGIIGFTDLLLAEDLSPTVRDYAQTVGSSAAILLTLINDLLDFAKIESGAVELEATPTDLRHHLEPTFATLRKLADQKTLAFHVEIDPSVPPLAELDFSRFRQIIMNVVGNAIKFTDEGQVTARLRAVRTGPRQLVLETTVEDSGIGIAPDAIERIFSPFDQAHVSVHRRFGGTGLGLSICRELCQLMGGNIDVRSTPGTGSTFRFTVAIRPSEEQPPAPDPAARPSFPHLALSHPASILVVDDVPTNRRLVGVILEKMGYAPTLASSGEEALALATERDFDIILMDVFMPGIDGYEATRAIRSVQASRTTQPLPYSFIVGLSADALPENRHRCLAAGMDGFLTKPIQLDELADALRQFPPA